MLLETRDQEIFSEQMKMVEQRADWREDSVMGPASMSSPRGASPELLDREKARQGEETMREKTPVCILGLRHFFCGEGGKPLCV